MSEATNQGATEQKAVVRTPEQQFRGNLEAMKPQFALVLPPHITPEKFARVAMTAVMQNPDLLKMDARLVIQELMLCATDGLIPDKREAAILPFKGKPKYLPMVGGILKKMRNSGDLKSINPMVVYANDFFEYWMDEEGPHLKHIPCFDRDPGPVRLTYCVLQTKDGGTYIEVITEAQMDKIRKASASGNNGPWGGDFADEMRRKSAIKRVSKRSPMSTDMETILDRDSEVTDAREVRDTAPIAYQTIDAAPERQEAQIPDDQPTPKPKKEAAKSTESTPPYNHAPGASNPPPAKSGPAEPSEPVGEGAATPGPAEAGSLPSRKQLGAAFQALFQKIGMKPSESSTWILKTTGGQQYQQLSDVEAALLLEDLKTYAIEKGIQP
jgi:recombination protein RecT